MEQPSYSSKTPEEVKEVYQALSKGVERMINSKSEVKDAAWDFLKTITSKEACIQSALEGIEPGRRSAWVDPQGA